MKRIIKEVNTSGIESFLFDQVPTLLKDLALVGTMAYKTMMYYSIRNILELDPEKRKRALDGYRESMRKTRNELSVANKTFSEALGENAILAWAVAPGFMLKTYAAEKVEVMLSPTRDIERREQISALEDLVFPSIGIDVDDPEYLGQKNAYIDRGASGGLMAWINGETGTNIYAGSGPTRVTLDSTGSSASRGQFSSNKYQSIFFGNMTITEAKDKEEDVEKKESKEEAEAVPLDVKPLLKLIKDKHGGNILKSIDEYFDAIASEYEKYARMNATISSTTGLSDFLEKMEKLKSEDAGFNKFDGAEFKQKLDALVDEQMDNEKFDKEVYVSAKPAQVQESLKSDKKAFKKEFMNDLFMQNWKDTSAELNKYFKKGFESLKEDINEEFNPEFWEEYDGQSKTAKALIKKITEANNKIDDFLENIK